MQQDIATRVEVMGIQLEEVHDLLRVVSGFLIDEGWQDQNGEYDAFKARAFVERTSIFMSVLSAAMDKLAAQIPEADKLTRAIMKQESTLMVAAEATK